MGADDPYGLQGVHMAFAGRKKRRRSSKAQQHGGACDITRTVLDLQLGGSSRHAIARWRRCHPPPLIRSFEQHGNASANERSLKRIGPG